MSAQKVRLHYWHSNFNLPILKQAFFQFKAVLEWWICTFFDEVFLQKITLMWRRWGTSQNFFLAFIDELWKTQKIRILKKWKKIAEDIIMLHMWTKNHNHMRYSFWYTKWEFFLSFWAIFCPLPLPPYNNPENQHFEKMEASGDAIILNLCNKKHNHMMYAYSDMGCNRHNFLIF